MADDYYTLLEIDSIIDGLATEYGALVTVEKLSQPSAQGRQAKALRLGKRSSVGNDAVMIIAGVHGAEWGSCEIVLNLAIDLLKAYQDNAGLAYGNKSFTAQEVQDLLDQRDIVIFPLVNPDGRHFSRTAIGRESWRRNCNPAYSPRDPEAIGVDINRNFDFLFDLTAFAPGSGVSASDSLSKPDFYQGPQAFSEAETQNVRELLDKYPRTRWFVDVHCTGQFIHYVWGDDLHQQADSAMNFRLRNAQVDSQRGLPGSGYGEYLHPNDLTQMETLARRFVADLQAVGGTIYSEGPTFEVTPYSGTSHDYAYSRHLVDLTKGKVLGFVVEWGRFDPQPLWPDMQGHIREVSAGLIGFCLAT